MNLTVNDAVLRLRIHPNIFISCLRDFVEIFIGGSSAKTIPREEFHTFLLSWAEANLKDYDAERQLQLYAAMWLRLLAYFEEIIYYCDVYGRDYGDKNLWFIPSFIMAALEIHVVYDDVNEYAYFPHFQFIERAAFYQKNIPSQFENGGDF
ncbi:MAG: hypothetical protein ACRCTY_08080 [Candidatus Adiutrix sp.]